MILDLGVCDFVEFDFYDDYVECLFVLVDVV